MLPHQKFRLYWATQPPPSPFQEERLRGLIPTEFSTEEDALHAAALLIRAGQHVWQIDRPEGKPISAEEIKEACASFLLMFGADTNKETPTE